MQKNILTPKRLTWLLAATLGLTPIITLAAGFQINENSPQLQGQATAGSASDRDEVSAIFDNPALLATLTSNQFYLGTSFIAPHINVKNAVASHDAVGPGIPFTPTPSPAVYTPVSGATGQLNVANSAYVPNLYSAYRLNPQWVAGLAITAPWGLETVYDGDSVLRYMSQDTYLRAINIAPELAFSLNPHWQFGFGVQLQQVSARFSNYDGDAAIGVADQATTLKGSNWGYGYTLGALFSPDDKTDIGLSYRSQINYTLKGTGEQYTTSGPILPNPPLFPGEGLYNSSTSVAAAMNTPAVANFSISRKLTQQWSVYNTEQMTFWNSLSQISVDMPSAYVKQTTIKLNWKNSMLWALGTQYAYNPQWQFRTGVAFDQTPTNNQDRDARIPDTNRVWGTVGATYQVNKRLRIDGAYEHIFMSPQSINTTQVVSQQQWSPVKQAGEYNIVQADYTGSADVFALGLNWLF